MRLMCKDRQIQALIQLEYQIRERLTRFIISAVFAIFYILEHAAHRLMHGRSNPDQ